MCKHNPNNIKSKRVATGFKLDSSLKLARVDLMRQAVEDGDFNKAMEYVRADGVVHLLPQLRTI